MVNSSQVRKLAVIILILAGLSGFGYFFGPRHQYSPAAAGTPPQQPHGQFLQSFFRSKSIYDDAFAAVKPVDKLKIAGGIVSHHFLARNLIAGFFAGIDPAGVERVILLAPDHYRRLAGHPQLWLTTLLPWQTPYGVMPADHPFLQGLLATGDGARQDGAFRQEHGIYILVPFIQKTFPQARLAPLILRGSPDYGACFALGQRLRRAAGRGTVLLVSSDFAHGVDAATARRLDQESLSHLKNLNIKDLEKIHADGRPGVAALAGFLGVGPRIFVPVGNQTSADFGDRAPANLTSYLTAYYQAPAASPFTLLFLGDLMFDRHIREVAETQGNNFIFKDLAGLLADHRLVIANLEGPLTDRPVVSRGAHRQEKSHYTFAFSPDWAETLKQQHLNLVHLGNNHLLDFGREGLEQTTGYLRRAGVDYFGGPLAKDRRRVLKEINGIKLAFVSHNQFASQGVEQTLDDLKEMRPRADLVIVYAHWDGEYRLEPAERTRNLGRLFIDQGADLIVGSHSHTVQPREAYKGKIIYYSLGNFVFDQAGREETRRGLALKVTVNPGNLALACEEIPLCLEKNGQTRLKNQ